MTLDRALTQFSSASRDLLASRELLRRVDAKYLVDAARLPELLDELGDGYAVLAVGSTNIATYENLYFDTPALRSFHDHRRGRRLRQKVRIRHYPERSVSFLEVKTKRSELVTTKHRRPIDFHAESLAAPDREFLRDHTADVDQLEAVLRVDYRRIALVHTEVVERVTIDFGLVATRAGQTHQIDFGATAVVEVKRAPDQRMVTPIVRALERARVRERSLSKYCTALVLLRPDVRHNRFLPDLRAVRALRIETPR